MAVGDYVTPEGLQIPTVEKLLEDLATEQRATMDPLLDTDPESPIGQLNGIIASHFREAFEVIAIAYGGGDPDKAEGVLLEGLSALTGTKRGEATRSKFVGSRKLKINLDANKTIAAGGATFEVDGDSSVKFVTTESVSSTLAGYYYVAAHCTVTGPVHCNANTLTVITTPVVGLNSVINEYDAQIGNNTDTDPQLRERREQELRATGSGTVDSLRADLLSIELEDGTQPVQDVTIFENVTESTDLTTGLPMKSLECMVYDGPTLDCPNDTIAQTIWNGKPGGIKLVGGSSGSALDSLGVTRTIPFTRPTLKAVKYAISLLYDPKLYAGDGAALHALIDRFLLKVKPGKLIRANDYTAALIQNVSGVVDITNMQLAFVGDPFPASGTNLALGLREMGTLQAGDIAITSTPL